MYKKKTDGFEEIIKKKYLEYHATAKSIYSFLKDNKKYTGSYSTIKKFTHDLKEDMIQKATLRFETNPGLQCQIDWKEELTLKNRNGESFTVNIFLSVLGYSRLKYIELTTERTQPTLFRCLRNAFEYFKGVPHELLFDNMRTVVDQSRTQFQTVVFNEKLHEFAKDAGFEPFACVAYRPRTKGKVEAVAHLMNRLKVYNDEFDTLEDLYKLVKQLNKEINVCMITSISVKLSLGILDCYQVEKKEKHL